MKPANSFAVAPVATRTHHTHATLPPENPWPQPLLPNTSPTTGDTLRNLIILAEHRRLVLATGYHAMSEPQTAVPTVAPTTTSASTAPTPSRFRRAGRRRTSWSTRRPAKRGYWNAKPDRATQLDSDPTHRQDGQQRGSGTSSRLMIGSGSANPSEAGRKGAGRTGSATGIRLINRCPSVNCPRSKKKLNIVLLSRVAEGLGPMTPQQPPVRSCRRTKG